MSQIHPGRHPFEELRELNLSTSDLARRIQVPANRKAGILDGQLTVTGDAAPYVADSFGTCSEFWLNIWEHYEFRLAEKKVSETIKALPTIEPDYALRWSVRGSRASVTR